MWGGVVDLVKRFRVVAEWVTTALFFLLFMIYLVGIAARYLFNAPIAWSDELAMVVFLWGMFLTDAFVSRDKDHVAFDILWERLPPGGRRALPCSTAPGPATWRPSGARSPWPGAGGAPGCSTPTWDGAAARWRPCAA